MQWSPGLGLFHGARLLVLPVDSNMFTYVYIYIYYTCIHVYIYIERERGRYICIYIRLKHEDVYELTMRGPANRGGP